MTPGHHNTPQLVIELAKYCTQLPKHRAAALTQLPCAVPTSPDGGAALSPDGGAALEVEHRGAPAPRRWRLSLGFLSG